MSRGKQRARRVPTQPAIVVAARTDRVLGIGLAVYLAILATMVAFESYAFILKSTIVPFLLLIAVVSRRFGGFVNDWAPFLGIVVLFDSLRSLVFAVVTHFDLPMYAVYAIDWERWLCGGAVAPLSAQQMRAALSQPLWLDRLFVLLHASHFLFFLLFGFLLWYLRREVFRTYAVAMLVLLYTSLLIHLLAPTVPPWIAARDFALLPDIERIIASVYNVHVPSISALFDVNPIAAMPSLHAAMPALCALVALHYVGRRGIVVALYAFGVAVAVVYLGEHYVVDVVAGVLLALAVYAGVRRWGAPAASLGTLPDNREDERLSPQRVAVSVLLVSIAFASGQLFNAWLGPLPMTTAFVERELVGRSPVANYMLGRIAHESGDMPRARVLLTRALGDLPGAAEQKVIRSFLAQLGDAGAPPIETSPAP